MVGKSRQLALGVGLAFVVVGVLGVSQVAARPRPAPRALPVVVEFELTHEVYSMEDETADAREESTTDVDGGREAVAPGPLVVETISSTDRFVWTFNGYTDWTLTKVCCADPLYDDFNDSGWSRQVRPDGTNWYRASPGDDWELTGTFDLAEGRTPMPDLSPRFPTSGGALADIPDVDLLVDRGILVKAGAEARLSRALELADRLGVERSDVIVYDHAGIIQRTVFAPLNLPLEYTELSGAGETIRSLSVTAIKSG